MGVGPRHTPPKQLCQAGQQVLPQRLSVGQHSSKNLPSLKTEMHCSPGIQQSPPQTCAAGQLGVGVEVDVAVGVGVEVDVAVGIGVGVGGGAKVGVATGAAVGVGDVGLPH